MQDQHENYREFKIYRKTSLILLSSAFAFAKDSALVLIATLAYRNSKHPAVRALSLVLGAGALRKAASRLFPAKPLLIVNEEGITYDPAVPLFNLSVAISWEEIGSLYLSELITPPSQQQPPYNTFNRLIQMFTRVPSNKQSTTNAHFLFIIPKDIEAFKRSRGFQDLETFKHGRNLLEFDVSRLIVNVFLLKTGTPFLIAQEALPVPLEEVLDRIRTLFADKIEACGIEIREEQKTTLSEDEPS